MTKRFAKPLDQETAYELYCKQFRFKPLRCLPALFFPLLDLERGFYLSLLWLLFVLFPYVRNRHRLNFLTPDAMIIQEDEILTVKSHADDPDEYLFQKLGWRTESTAHFMNVSISSDNTPVYTATVAGMSDALVFGTGAWLLEPLTEEEIAADYEEQTRILTGILKKNPIPKLYHRKGLGIDPEASLSRVSRDKPHTMLTLPEQIAADYFAGDLVPAMEYICRLDEMGGGLIRLYFTDQEQKLFSLVKKQVKKRDRAAKKVNGRDPLDCG